jgi:hypothetical protein
MAMLLRFLAGAVLLVAVIFAVNDATRSLAADHVTMVTLHQTWSAVSPSSLRAAQTVVERYTHPAVWNWGALKLLQLPTWAILGLLGCLLAYLGRRRRRIDIYAN